MRKLISMSASVLPTVLHETFKQRVIATESQNNQFELWLNVWGEFTVIAYVERKDKEPLWLTRYLDLPGRPPE
jgi:hypothetical protein